MTNSRMTNTILCLSNRREEDGVQGAGVHPECPWKGDAEFQLNEADDLGRVGGGETTPSGTH